MSPQRFTRLFVLSLVLGLGACVAVDDDPAALDSVEQGLHPSGVCRIEGRVSFTSKVVSFYRNMGAPTVKWFEYRCNVWVGTSECCSRQPSLGLSFEECKQLRHDPDCPAPDGGGGSPGDDDEDELDPN